MKGLLGIVVVLALLVIVPAASAQSPTLTVGMIYISPTQIPWSAAHRAAYQNVLTAIEGVTVTPDGEGFTAVDKSGNPVVKTLSWTATTDFSSTAALRAVEDMIQKGAKMIFVTAENWCQDLNETVAPKYPDVNFACIRGPVAKNLISMYPKSWEGFCAACAAATAVVTEPHLGLLGAYENNPQVASNHGACAQCFADAWAESHTSAVKVSAVYVNSWGNEPDEMLAAESLAAEGAKVLAVHQDSTAAASALAGADPKVWVIGYDRDWAQFTKPSDHILASVVIDWTDVYSKAIHSTLAGTFEGFRWNPGLETGAVKLAPFAPSAPIAALNVANEYTQKLMDGWRPCGTDEDMWGMDHYKKCFK
jgi:basic membrane lipoprotein Med (substrate-binding protein (PBP1-ABC) superfamily)